MKILISVELYYPQTIGSAYATYRLANGLGARGHEVFVICSGDGLATKRAREKDIEVFRVSSLPIILAKKIRFSPLAHHLVGPILDEVKPDIVHAQDHLLIGSSVIEAALKRNIPIVGTNHFHPDNLLHYLNAPPRLEEKLRKAAWKHFSTVFGYLDYITTPSEIAKKVMQANGVKKDITVVSNGIDLGRFRPRPKEEARSVAQKYGLSNEDKNILFVGRLEKEKNIDVLIRAMKIVSREMPAKLLICGFGSGEEKLTQLIRELALENYVKFLGKVPDEDLVKLYNFADLFATASTVELQGLVVMEAMASGLPIVSSDGMALPELVRDGINGLIFPSGDYAAAAEKILTVLGNKKLSEGMGRKSLELIAEHDFERSLDQYENIYGKAISGETGKKKINRSLFIISKLILDTPLIAIMLLFALGVATATAEIYENSNRIKSAFHKFEVQTAKTSKKIINYRDNR